MSGDEGIPEKYNNRFMAVERNQVEIRTILNRICNNELVHLHGDIKEIKGWIYGGVMALVVGVSTLIIKTLFF